ncbi:MAG TPA: hypothetical protein VFV99_13140, partial [Kofleriaceae bacterium]|nr:hypothetical protein [Kofleriaceae bacterium]
MKGLLATLVVFVAACGGHDPGDIDELLGATCRSDRDCEVRCYLDPQFPGGICSVPCTSDNDCPFEALCMSTSGGMCLYACPDFDCNRLGPGWTCRSRGRE